MPSGMWKIAPQGLVREVKSPAGLGEGGQEP